MRYRYTLGAALLFAALLVWVLAKERGRVPEKGEVFGLDVAQVTRLEVVPKEGMPLTVEKRGDQWWITAPFQGWASKDEVERVLRTLCELKPDRRPDEDPSKPEYGLAQPVLTARMWCGGKKFEIALGDETPVGSQRFARIEGRKGLFLVSSFLKTDLEKKPEDLRDKKLAHYDKDKVSSLALQNANGTFEIVARQEGGGKEWYLSQPMATRADRWAVDNLVNRPGEVEAKAFEPMPKNLAEVGLDKPVAKLVLRIEGDKPVTLMIGKTVEKSVESSTGAGAEPQQLVYAMLEGRPELLLVEASFASDLSKDLMGLRDKHIVVLKRDDIVGIKVQRKQGLSFTVTKRAGQWFLDSPQPGKAKQTKVDDLLWDLEDLQTSEFIEKPADLKQYGLAIPQMVIAVTTKDNKTIKIMIGDKASEDRYYCKTSESDTVYVISDVLLGALPSKIDDIKSTE